MSYPYRVVIRKTVSTEVRGEDSTQSHLRPIALLPEEKMRHIFEECLRERGYKEKGGRFHIEQGESVEWVVDLKEMTVTARVQMQEKIHHQIERREEGDEWDRRKARQKEDEVRHRLEVEVESLAQTALNEEVRRQKNTELQERAGQLLEQTANERRNEIERLLVDVHARALKEKATTLGEISYQEEQWEQDQYELTIKITE